MQDNPILSKIEEEIDSKILSNKEIALKQLNEIIKSLPPEIKEIIESAFIYKRIPKEYLLSSILFAFSNAAGLAFKLSSMNYVNYSNLYFAIVGSRGDVKSPAMDLACSSLNEYDDNQYKQYKNKLAEKKSNDSFEYNEEIIKRKQLLVQNATIEAVMYNHSQNPYSIGIFVDELFYLIEKMANKNSNEGAVWRVFLLQGSTNKHIDVNRKTTESYRVAKSYPTLLGSIQHQFISKMFANGNLESGLIDRILFTNKLTDNPKISKDNLPEGIISNYQNSLTNLLEYRIKIEEKNQELFVNLDQQADEKIHNYSQSILDKQQSLNDNTKEYLSKMMISIHKLVLLIHLIKKSGASDFQDKISIETVDLAILLNEFFFTNFKIVLESKNSNIDNGLFLKELIKRGVENEIQQKDIVSLSGLSKGQVSKLYKKELEFRKLETGNSD